MAHLGVTCTDCRYKYYAKVNGVTTRRKHKNQIGGVMILLSYHHMDYFFTSMQLCALPPSLFLVIAHSADKGRFGSYMKLCDFTLLFMTLQVELRLNKRIISETQTS